VTLQTLRSKNDIVCLLSNNQVLGAFRLHFLWEGTTMLSVRAKAPNVGFSNKKTGVTQLLGQLAAADSRAIVAGTFLG
jgi:hypothetical protein